VNGQFRKLIGLDIGSHLEVLSHGRKKIEAILQMDRPRNARELRMFIGCVNYYQDMWPSHAHILKPLTDQSGLKKRSQFNW